MIGVPKANQVEHPPEDSRETGSRKPDRALTEMRIHKRSHANVNDSKRQDDPREHRIHSLHEFHSVAGLEFIRSPLPEANAPGYWLCRACDLLRRRPLEPFLFGRVIAKVRWPCRIFEQDKLMHARLARRSDHFRTPMTRELIKGKDHR